MNKIKIGVLVTGDPILDLDAARENAKEIYGRLEEIGVDVVRTDDVVTSVKDAIFVADKFKKEDVDLLLVLVGTFTEDPIPTTVTRRLMKPVILWATPEPQLGEILNIEVDCGSLVGLMMNASALRKMGKHLKVIFGKPSDEKALDQIKKTIKVVGVIKRLQDARIGLVGYRAPGFYDATFDEVQLKNFTGLEVVHIDLSELYSEMQKISEEDAENVMTEAVEKGYKFMELTKGQQIREARIYLALKKLIGKHDLSGVAVKCWPELKFSSCFSLSKLSDDGTPAGCEGDINGTATMLILYHLTGKPVFFCDVFHLDEERNTILTFHCGAAAASLAEDPHDVTLWRHPLGEGVTAEFPIKPGYVTIARLGNILGKYRMLITSGEAMETKQMVRGNPLEIKLNVNVTDFLRKVTSEGIEHHYLIVHGDVRDELVEFCDLLKIDKVMV